MSELIPNLPTKSYASVLNDKVIKINNSIYAICYNDDNTVIFRNLLNINNIPLDVNYLNYFNEVISKKCDIPSYKINSIFNYNLKLIILKRESSILEN